MRAVGGKRSRGVLRVQLRSGDLIDKAGFEPSLAGALAVCTVLPRGSILMGPGCGGYLRPRREARLGAKQQEEVRA